MLDRPTRPRTARQPDEVVEAAVALSQRIAANSHPAVKALKEIVDLALPIDKALEHQGEVNREMGRSPHPTARRD